MDLEPTEEQRQLTESLNRMLLTHYHASTRLGLLESERGWSREMWGRYADLGLLGLAIEEQYGGAGAGAGELATVMECLGRHLALEPYLSTVVLGASLVQAAGSPNQKAALLPGVASGEVLLAFAGEEPGSGYALDRPLTRANRTSAGWSLDGEKTAVLGADAADRLVVSARTEDGVGLFLVDAADTERVPCCFHDGHRSADVLLRSSPAEELGAPSEGLALLDPVLDVATTTLGAEAVGAMDRLLWLTVDHLRTRVQFGAPIGRFQALQHRVADMYVAVEQARSIGRLAQLSVVADEPSLRRQTVRAAKIHADQSGRLVAQEAIQLHGGIGMTWEHQASHYAKRLEVNARTLSDTASLVALLGADGGLVNVDPPQGVLT